MAVGGAAAAATLVWWHWREHRFDALVSEVAGLYDVPPKLVRAVIHRESRFNVTAIGRRGEVGLMQVTAGASAEWAAAESRPPPSTAELFVPDVNLRAGTWYLGRAIRRWAERVDDPLPYALAEYNAGPRHSERWASNASGSAEFIERIDFPTTRRYVQDILRHYRGHVKPSAAMADPP